MLPPNDFKLRACGPRLHISPGCARVWLPHMRAQGTLPEDSQDYDAESPIRSSELFGGVTSEFASKGEKVNGSRKRAVSTVSSPGVYQSRSLKMSSRMSTSPIGSRRAEINLVNVPGRHGHVLISHSAAK